MTTAINSRLFDSLFVSFLIVYKEKHGISLDNEEVHGAQEFATYLDDLVSRKIIKAKRIKKDQ